MDYGPVHPDRYSLSKVVLRKKGVIVHTSESGDSTLSSLLYRMSLPGDRPYTKPDGSTGYYGSSYHALADGSTSNYVQVQPESHGPFSAPPLNKEYWHICMPGWSRQTREEWLDAMSYGQIKAVAKFIVEKSRIDGFPTVRLSPTDLANGGKGYAGHRDVTYGFQISGGHTDPGPNFPWDVLNQEIQKLLKPQTEEDDMARIVRIVDTKTNDWVGPEQFVVTGGQIEWLTSKERRDAIIASGHAQLNPVTNAPYKFGRDSLKWFRLIGPLPTGGTFTDDEFLKD